jgi:uncharacterized membrane protein YccC
MALKLFSLDDKIGAMHVELVDARRANRSPGSAAQRQYEILKAIAADLRGRQELPRNNTLGELSRSLQKMKDAPRNGPAFDRDYMTTIVNIIVNRWPTISQALERFGDDME